MEKLLKISLKKKNLNSRVEGKTNKREKQTKTWSLTQRKLIWKIEM